MFRFGPLCATLALAAIATAQDAPRPRVGLVLSGGGARGAAHVGVLEVLEELRVPVDFVVGTSMGAIVGGLYAAGYAPDEIRAVFDETDWSATLSDSPPRGELWFRRRQDRRRFLIDLELGWRDGGPALPPGLILGLNAEALLERLLLPVATQEDFDQLEIPFRCVATDLTDGSAVVFSAGSLSRAIRASMSLPGILAPVNVDGRFLIDGGVVDNIPVDVARELGADIVIVVDISTPLDDPQALRSFLGVTNQSIGILMSQNRTRSMALLEESDIGMVPELGDIGVMDFRRAAEAIQIGRETAGSLRERLAPLGVDPQTWATWVADQRRPGFVSPTIRRLIVAGDTRLSEDVIRAFAGLEEGEPLDEAALARAREGLAGLGIFERIEVGVTSSPDAPGEADVTLAPVEKDWGPQYFRFGLAANSDLRGGGEFQIGVQHTWTPLNSLGGEWRNEVQIGTRTRLYSEFYQPLDDHLRWFVVPSIEYEQDNLPLIVDRQKVAQINARGVELAAAVGRTLWNWGELRVRYGWVVGSATPEIALPGLLPDKIDISTGQLTTTLVADTLDSITFPRSGLLGALQWEYANEAFGGDSGKSVLAGAVSSPLSFGDLTVLPSLEAGTTLDGEALVGGEFYLGGFQRLSGLGPREISGNHFGLGVVQCYYQLSERTTNFGIATYLGASLEAGGTWEELDSVSADDFLLGGSLFVGADTFFGPAYLALGYTEGGNTAAYVFIGSVF